MEGRTYEDADWEYDRALYEWIYRYNAYERLGCSREQVAAKAL
jgi:hypothetical protein